MAALPDDVRALFQGPNYAHLATLMPDGSPHSVAIWAGAEGDNVVFFTQEGSLKANNMAKDPRVAISITAHENPYVTAQLRGRVVEVRGAEATNRLADELGGRYTGEPFPYHPPTSRMYVVEVDKV